MTIRKDGDKVAIIVDVKHLQSLRVAIQPCMCGHIKSKKTSDVRALFVKVFGLGVFMKSGDVRHIETEELDL